MKKKYLILILFYLILSLSSCFNETNVVIDENLNKEINVKNNIDILKNEINSNSKENYDSFILEKKENND